MARARTGTRSLQESDPAKAHPVVVVGTGVGWKQWGQSHPSAGGPARLSSARGFSSCRGMGCTPRSAAPVSLQTVLSSRPTPCRSVYSAGRGSTVPGSQARSPRGPGRVRQYSRACIHTTPPPPLITEAGEASSERAFMRVLRLCAVMIMRRGASARTSTVLGRLVGLCDVAASTTQW